MSATSAPIDAASMLERVLRLSDQLDELIGQFGSAIPPVLVQARAGLATMEEELQDLLDVQESRDVMADESEAGTISLAELRARLQQ